MSKTLFEKIIDREIPAKIVYEDDKVIAFQDIKPQAPVHVLIVPKKPIPRIAEAQPEDHQILGHLLLKAAAIAKQFNIEKSGFRLVFNNGPTPAKPCRTCIATSSAAGKWIGRQVDGVNPEERIRRRVSRAMNP